MKLKPLTRFYWGGGVYKDTKVMKKITVSLQRVNLSCTATGNKAMDETDTESETGENQLWPSALL